MNAPRLVLREANPAILFSLFSNNSRTTSSRSCQHILRQFSQSQRRHLPPEKIEANYAYQPYPLNSRPGAPPRNDQVPDTSITSPAADLPKTRSTAPSQSASETSSSTPPSPGKATAAAAAAATAPSSLPESEAQKTRPAPRRKFKARKAAMKLTPSAVAQLQNLLNQPEPKLIKVGVRNRGCSGLAYHLEYVDKPGMFDEEVEQDGVKVLIDSKALFSIIGSEMDWIEDKLNQRFVFKNPNIKEECGCGESFMV